ncbi:hypothetical protein [Fructobacillus tropaeoli]|uniref:hypothetical protein n=1 Tax=Fructobacillus tropaeoli TaxID=709323 RepID=UPI001945B4C8|nr:hypothetical protein [Fructobacillus tropaeoli]GIC70595.1 hypothetical protein FT12353_12700 [Fructobacillus tropaeoli]
MTSKQREILFENECYFNNVANIFGDAPITVSYHIEIAPDEEISVKGYELTISPTEALKLIANPKLIEVFD